MAGPDVVSMVSDMGQSPQGVLKKRNRRMLVNVGTPSSSLSCRGHGFCAPHRVVICVASLQELLGTKDADFSAVWLTGD
jgi:hypothetical protein